MRFDERDCGDSYCFERDAKVCAVEDGALGDNFVGEAEHDHEYEQRNERDERRPVGINARIGPHVAAVCAHNHAGSCQHEPH